MIKNQFLASIDSKKIKLGLNRTQQLLKACNNPHQNIKILQTVGTNGKGTVSAMISNVLVNNNYKTGLFTSPHLVSFNERIRINNISIPNVFIDSFINKYKEIILKIGASFFEISTVLAVYYFAKQNVDIAIMETGLGGRYDSVTALGAQVLIFTSISYDHMHLLGNSLDKIASEKAGAITKNTKLIISINQPNVVKTILTNKSKKFGLKINYSRNLKRNNRFKFIDNLPGLHQVENALLAQKASMLCKKKFGLSLVNITLLIQKTFWPGRIQFISKSPNIIFDVAHNESGINAFVQYFKNIKNKYSQCYLILGFENKKNIGAKLNILCELFDVIIITETQIRKSMPAEYIYKFLKVKSNQILKINVNVTNAIKYSTSNMDLNDILVILGSHYFGPYVNKIFKKCFEIENKIV